MRTLVISDFHLGASGARDLLRRPPVLERLLAEIAHADRLVLLGDTLELREGDPAATMVAAEPVLRAIAAALQPGTPVLLLAGNHDWPLVGPWLKSRQAGHAPLGADDRVAIQPGTLLEQVAGWLAPSPVEVHHPGVWLGDGIWAHHGHYLDRILNERHIPPGARTAEDYESSFQHRTAAHLTAAFTARLPFGVGRLIDRAGAAALGAVARLRPIAASLPGVRVIAPLGTRLLAYQLRRAGLPAIATVTNDLAPDATDVIFGHLHRAGPRDGDAADLWVRDGRRYWNTGCWTHEPLLLTGADQRHPYWPGGAIWVEGATITPVQLLADVAL